MKTNLWNAAEIKAAWAMGAKAYYDGKNAAPALDKNLTQMLAEKNGPVGSGIAILKAWAKGWHAQNTSCLFPDFN